MTHLCVPTGVSSSACGFNTTALESHLTSSHATLHQRPEAVTLPSFTFTHGGTMRIQTALCRTACTGVGALLPGMLSFTWGLVVQLGNCLPGMHEAVVLIPSIT